MLKEINYYLTTNRFSQIAEEIDIAVRNYGDSFINNQYGDEKLREQARRVCQNYVVESGIRSSDDSFINIDLEFFENGELQENNLNLFIKNVLKASGYQKILWEYMGTTGLMTDVSKDAMKTDGFNYEKYIPVNFKTEYSNSEKINRNFCKLVDNSGFDWSKGYDPNYTVEKNGWIGAFDSSNTWIYIENIKNISRTQTKSNNNTLKIQLIKTENGCMLYDFSGLLIHPIILWYLMGTQEIYGGEQTDTQSLIEEIKNQMAYLGVEKITQIATGLQEEKLLEQYSKQLGALADSKLEIVSTKFADEEIIKIKDIEKTNIIEAKSVELQRKINAIINTKPNVESNELVNAIESGKLKVELNTFDIEDAKDIGITIDEYNLINSLSNAISGSKKQAFEKSILILCLKWNVYKRCGKSKQEFIQTIYDFLKDKKDSTISYDVPLREIIGISADKKIHTEKLKDDGTIVLSEYVKSVLPLENQEVCLKYLSELPEQKEELKQSITFALKNAIKNYLTIRASTGLSIKELFDYTIKAYGGKLPKSSFEPPVVGYITPELKNKNTLDDKNVYFDITVKDFISELCAQKSPEKEINVTSIIEKNINHNNDKTVLLLGSKNNIYDTVMEYDLGEYSIDQQILQILREISFKQLDEKTKLQIQNYAIEAKSPEQFIKLLNKDFQLQYNFNSNVARNIFTKVNDKIDIIALENISTGFDEVADDTVTSSNYYNNKINTIIPSYKQINLSNSNSKVIGDYRVAERKSCAAGTCERIQKFNMDTIQSVERKTSVIDSVKAIPADLVQIPTNSNKPQHINVNESYPISESLRETMHIAAERQSQNSQMSKMNRLNANYEHDKAVLAKSDPVFAKNQFWDVGHAEGSEEMTQRDMDRYMKSMNEDKKEHLLGSNGRK